MGDFEITVEDEPNRHVVHLSGALDLDAAPQVREHLEDIVAGSSGEIVVDLRGLDFMDSVGLAQVMWFETSVRAAGRRIAFIPGPEPVQRVFELTGLLEHFTWVKAED